MQPIYTQTVGAGGAASITFNNIPQGFTDLQLVASIRGTENLLRSGARIQFNNDSSAIYSETMAFGDGASASSARASSGTSIVWHYTTDSLATSNTFSNNNSLIPNYTGAQFKSVLIDSVTESNAATGIITVLNAGLYRSTNPITMLRISANTSFAANSTFTLYGITKG